MIPLKAVLFDLDGTLLDSLADIADAMNTVLTKLGFPTHPLGAYRYFVGDGVPLLVQRAFPGQTGDPDLIARGGSLLRDEYRNSWNKKTRPYSGVPELLDGLSRREVPMSVFSNKPDEFTQIMVSTLLRGWDFSFVRGIKPGTPRKPDPKGAMDACRSMGVKAAEVCYLGDTKTDMETAENAGMFAVGALWGFRTREELESSGARKVIEWPEELLQFFT